MSYTSKNWRTEMQGASQAQDRQFGEALRIIPCNRAPNSSAFPDHANAQTVTGIFMKPSREIDLTLAAKVTSRDPSASFHVATLAWEPIAGDWIERCCDGEVYEIKKVDKDGVARVTFDLFQMGVQRL